MFYYVYFIFFVLVVDLTSSFFVSNLDPTRTLYVIDRRCRGSLFFCPTPQMHYSVLTQENMFLEITFGYRTPITQSTSG